MTFGEVFYIGSDSQSWVMVARAQQLVSVTRKEVNTRGLPRFQSTPPAFLSAIHEDAVFQFILLFLLFPRPGGEWRKDVA